MLKLYIKTHGCQMNEYDSAKIVDILRDKYSFCQVESPDQANLLVLNTCSIREKAQEKVFSMLGKWRELKAKNPGTLIAVAGCVASQEGTDLQKRAPYVDFVFGPQTIHRLPEMIEQRKHTNNPVVDISFPEIEKFDNLPEPTADGPTAFVTIMEGCNKYCTYCIVPYTRGQEISRPLDDLIVEVSKLAEQGVKEITLLGQNVNAYRGAMHDGNTADLAELIYYCSEIDGIERIRFTTSHPVEFNQRLIDAYSHIPKLVSHLHLPVQSGSDQVLARMKRGHTALEYKQKIRKLRAVRPDICISSDFIVGFPGETDDDFEATLDLIAAVGFDQSFSFIYSRRPGTPASNLYDDVPIEVKKQRLKILQARLNQQATNISHGMVGTKQKLLVASKSKKNAYQLSGRTENNRVVNFASENTSLIGNLVDVLVLKALPNSLLGELIAA